MSDPNLFDYIRLHSAPLMLGAIGYGNAKRGKTGVEDFHVMNSGWYDNIDQITYFRPYFRTIVGHDHTMFVFDVDTEVSENMSVLYTDDELREIKLRAVMEEFDDPKWKSFFTYISGQGMYLVQKYYKQVNKMVFESIVFGEEDSLFIRCTGDGRHSMSASCDGWHNRTQELVKVKMVHGEPVHIKIDKRMFNHEGGRLFRGVYSPYFKIKGSTYFCVPIEWDGDSIDIEKTLHNSRQENFRNPQPISIPKFAYEDKIKELIEDLGEDALTRVSRRYSPSREGMGYLMQVPLPTDELTKDQELLLDEMKSLVTGDVVDTPPCMKNCFEQKFHRFWSRAILLRYFANLGYSPAEIATFIRFRINDAQDNKPENQPKLLKYVKTFFGDPNNPNIMSSCKTLQDDKHPHYSCAPEDAKACRRTYPMNDYPVQLNVIDSGVEAEGGFDQWIQNEENIKMEETMAVEQKHNFEKITTLAKQIFDTSENLEIIKTTRAGVTTSLVNQVAQTGKRMIVVSPTNRIGEETFRDAMKIAHQVYGVDITGAILSANTKSCLKLRFELKDLEHRKKEEKEWGDGYEVQWKNLAFHFKPSCISEKDGKVVECEYYESRFPNPLVSPDKIPLPVIASEILDYQFDGNKEGICAYTSVINEMPSFDILFITYDKLNAVLMNDKSDDAEIIRNTLLSDFSVLFLDEISQLAQHSPLSFNIIKKEITEEGGTVTHYNYFDKLYEEYDRLIQYSPHETAQLMGEYVDIFINTFKPMVDGLFILNEDDGKPFSVRHENPIDADGKEKYDEMFTAFYSMLQKFAKDYNIHLSYIEQVLLLLKSDFWWFVNVPTNEYSVNASFISSPKIVNIRSFIRDFDSFPNKQVLVTDATMPLIKMSDLLGIKFKKFLVGDPRDTQSHQLVISDTKKVSVRSLLAGEKSKDFNTLVKFINKVCEIHDPKDIMLVLPNSGRVKRHMEKLKGKKIPMIDITYYRSDITVGVASDKRVMIAVCPPQPPTGSYQWLAQYYHEWRLFLDESIETLSKKLEDMNAYQTFYQTIGRVKSPDNSTRSVVYAWGINSDKLHQLMGMDNDVPLPNITTFSHRGADLKYLPVVGLFWKQYGFIANPNVIKVMEFVKKNKGSHSLQSLIRRLFRSANNRKKSEIMASIIDTPKDVLDKYGITTQITPQQKLYISAK